MQPSTPSPDPAPRSAFLWQTLLVFLAFFAVVFFYQWMEGAYESEFGGHPDEAAHYVTGLMIHDYLAGGLLGSPLAYAENYYKHYPKVALGNWPPVFYLAQAAWMLVFGPGRSSALLLMTMLTAALATLVFRILKEEFNGTMAATGTLLFVSLPLIQKYDGMVMGEILTATLMFGAVICFGRFLDNGRNSDAIWFGLLSALAIMTKGNGGALVLVPPVAILLTRKFSVLKRPALWIAAGLVVVIAGPWTWHFREQCKSGWEEPAISWHFTRQALVYFPLKFLIALGFVLAVLVAIGCISLIANRPKNIGKWASFAALLVSVPVFQSIIPAGQEARHLIPAIPCAILFAMAGLSCLIGWLARRELPAGTVQTSACAVLIALFFSTGFLPATRVIGFSSIGTHPGFSPFQVGWKGYSGFGPVVDTILADPANKNAVFLISSDARGEGMFVSEVAMRDRQRPGHVVERASKLLASSKWNGGDYKTKPESSTQEGVLKSLLESPIQLIVIDSAMPDAKEHNLLLRATVESHPQSFKRIDSSPIIREGVSQSGPIYVFRVQRS